MNQLEELKKHTKVVIDTSDFGSIARFRPIEATTNPTLILNSALKPEYRHLLEEAVAFARNDNGKKSSKAAIAIDRLLCNFGIEILKLIPGRVSIEVDARLSFDTKKSVERACSIISLFEKEGVDRERILIKLASTWEGIKAAEILQRRAIQCNMTLLFSMIQAAAAAQAHTTLISPFVGRILDWHMKHENRQFSPAEDPGVMSVRNIYSYFKKFGISTEVMGASFRNREEILELAGCDLLTIGPKFLEELEAKEGEVPHKLKSLTSDLEDVKVDEKSFRFELNQNQMATEKLSEGVRLFIRDTLKLEDLLLKML